MSKGMISKGGSASAQGSSFSVVGRFSDLQPSVECHLLDHKPPKTRSVLHISRCSLFVTNALWTLQMGARPGSSSVLIQKAINLVYIATLSLFLVYVDMELWVRAYYLHC